MFTGIVEEIGKKPKFNFEIKDHQELGLLNDGMDFEAASKISKSRFVVFKDSLALLNRALINFMLDIHTKEHLYKEIYGEEHIITPKKSIIQNFI